MSTVGRVLAKKCNVSLKDILHSANIARPLMKKNGALTKLGIDEFTLNKTQWKENPDVMLVLEMAKTPQGRKHIVEFLKDILQKFEKNQFC